MIPTDGTTVADAWPIKIGMKRESMNIIRRTLAACSLACLIFILISSTFFDNGLNLISFILIIFFGINAFYLYYMRELSQPSRMLRTLAGYFAFTALELEYRAKIAEMKDEIKSEETASKILENSEYRNDRLKAAEDFLRLITVGAEKHDSTTIYAQKQIVNNKDEIAPAAPALSALTRVPLESAQLKTASLRRTPLAALASDLEATRTRLNS